FSPPWFQGTQETESESHPEWRSYSARSSGDVGGNFFSQKRYVNVSDVQVHRVTSGWRRYDSSSVYRGTYKGPLTVTDAFTPGTMPFPSYNRSSDAALNAYGAAAVAKCAPTKPTADLATALLETFHDGLPKLLGKHLWSARVQDVRGQVKSPGSEYLNYQFGWKPLVSDILDFVKTVRNMDRLIQQYVRDSQRVVRRRYSFPPEASVTESVTRNQAFPSGRGLGGDMINFDVTRQAQVVRRRETSVRRWFSGAFVYHLPQTFLQDVYTPFADDWQVARRLLGLDLTIETLWELAPWSWAVDWFTNVGDVLYNADAWASEGLVMRYGYIMEHSIVRDTYSYVGPTYIYGSSYEGRPSSVTLVSETKVRRQANPFGFGLTMGALSGTQKSILAAVGLTRLK
ncbi:maturation protein, partial [ssRNA phage Esthiorhiza.2_41]